MKTKLGNRHEIVAKAIKKAKFKASVKLYVGGLIAALGMTTMLMGARDEGVYDTIGDINNGLRNSREEEEKEEKSEDSTETSGD